MKSSATVPTAHAARYMVQLCKHFGHKIPASWDGQEGRITFEAGEAALRATPDTLLLVSSAADPASLSQVERVVASHLERFAFREPGLAVEWRRGA